MTLTATLAGASPAWVALNPLAPLHVAQSVLNADITELPGRLRSLPCGDKVWVRLEEELQESYASVTQSPPPAGSLHPHISPSRHWRPPPDDHVQPPWPPHSDVLRHVLLYSHGLEVVDPLPAAVAWVRQNPADINVVSEAVQFWLDFWPLVERGVITCVPEVRQPLPDLPLVQLASSQDFRADLLSLLKGDELAERYVVAYEREYPPLIRTGLSSTDADQQEEHEFQQLLSFVLHSGWGDICDDLVDVLHWQQHGKGSILIPSRRHLDLAWILIKHGLSMSGTMSRGHEKLRKILSLNVPHLKEIDATEMMTLRLNSDALESWRRELDAALEILDALPEDASASVQLQELQYHMSDAARTLGMQADLRRRGMVTALLRPVGIASLVGIATPAAGEALLSLEPTQALIAGGLGALGAALGAAPQAAAEAVAGARRNRTGLAAQRAAAHHALVLGGMGPG